MLFQEFLDLQPVVVRHGDYTILVSLFRRLSDPRESGVLWKERGVGNKNAVFVITF